MAYASLDDMVARFGRNELVTITDRDNVGDISEAVFTQAQTDGDAEIDAYLRPQYVLPLEHVPPNLVRLACDVYRYYLYGNLVPDYAQKRYDGAVATLKLIMAGKLDLNQANDAAPAPEEQIHVKTVAPSIFSDDRLRNY